MQDQDQNQAVINTLKVRLFDAEESLRGESQFKEQFFGELAQILGLVGEEATDPRNYILGVQRLKDQLTPKEVVGEVVS